jgi:hypothetical protein
MRHTLNLRYTARGLPHNWHRRTILVENFGFLLAFNMSALVAIG